MRWNERGTVWVCFLLLLFICIQSLPTLADEPSSESHWYQIKLADIHVGWQHTENNESDDVRISSTEMSMSLKRGEITVNVSVESEWKERLSGAPISVKMMQDMSAMKTITRWSFLPDMIKSMETSGGPPITKDLPLPNTPWLTPYQAQQVFERKLKEGHKEVVVQTMSPEIGPRVVTVTYSRTGEDTIEIMGREVDVTIWDMVNDAMPQMVTRQWIDQNGLMVASEINIGIGVMMMTLVDKATALQDSSSEVEIFESMFIEPDQQIGNPWNAHRVVMKVKSKDGTDVDLPSTGSQTVAGEGDGFTTIVVDTSMAQPVKSGDATNPEFLGHSGMINPKDEVILGLHAEVVQSLPSDASSLDRLDAMREFVHEFIEEKNLSSAFASASEVARTREGDCTEHGVLLASLLRADGIPSRVVFGLVYVPGLGKNKQGVFGWHMWTQAMIDDGWVDVDATLPVRFSGGHVTTGTSSLDEGTGAADMAGMISSLNNLEIDVLRVDSK